jgi:hypothetical protein
MPRKMKTMRVKTWRESPTKVIFSPVLLEPEVLDDWAPPAPCREREPISKETKIQ